MTKLNQSDVDQMSMSVLNFGLLGSMVVNLIGALGLIIAIATGVLVTAQTSNLMYGWWAMGLVGGTSSVIALVIHFDLKSKTNDMMDITKLAQASLDHQSETNPEP